MDMSKKKLCIFSIIAVAVQVWLDQYTKGLAVRHLKGTKGLVLIDGVLQLFYVENRGAAFGILQNSTVFFCIVTAFILIAIIYVYIRMPLEKKYMPLFVLLTFLTAGAIGNLIDRIANGFVVDFIYFSLIDFPVFNTADIYVTVSTAFIILLSLLKYRDDEFSFLRFKRDAEYHENELLKKGISHQKESAEETVEKTIDELDNKDSKSETPDCTKTDSDTKDAPKTNIETAPIDEAKTDSDTIDESKTDIETDPIDETKTDAKTNSKTENETNSKTVAKSESESEI